MDDHLPIAYVVTLGFCLAALGGLGRYLLQRKRPVLRRGIGAILVAGLLGATVAMIGNYLFCRTQNECIVVVAVASLVGLAGVKPEKLWRIVVNYIWRSDATRRSKKDEV